MYPAKKYCDITGLEAPYTDPHSKLRYANPAAFAIARSLPHPHAQAFLALRGAQTIVARFADTVMGYREAEEGRLAVGRTWEESQALLLQTEAALLLPRRLDFNGAVDVGGLLSRLHRSACIELIPDETGILCPSFPSSSSSSSSSSQTPSPLAPLTALLSSAATCPHLLHRIRTAINPRLKSLADSASAELAAIRAARRDNRRQLDESLQRAARRVVEGGGMDEAQVSRRRGRGCVAVRAGKKSAVTPGGVTLDVSNTGATLFVEPVEAIELNNNEAELSGQEAEEEKRVLREMAEHVADCAPLIRDLTDRIVALDLACARARHALWMGASPPVLLPPTHPLSHAHGDTSSGVDTPGGTGTGGNILAGRESDKIESYAVEIRGIQHPVLLEMYLDLLVPAGVAVVVISGSNAGGKTAALKTLGIAALMAKAGLFLPLTGALKGGEAGQGMGESGEDGEQARGRVAVVAWYDRVVADIGDEQSLEQSLSTFSAHMRQVSRILLASSPSSPSSPSSASSPSSPALSYSSPSSSSASSSPFSSSTLILLDEAGSGTDPSEGAALAAAILKHLAGCNGLTLATTHYADLKKLKVGREGEWAKGRVGGGGMSERTLLTLAATHYADLEKLRVRKGLPCSLLCLTSLLTPPYSVHPPGTVPSFRQAADSRFENASVAFDPVSLRPSFHILWGLPGTSHALSLAASRGLPPSLVARAARLARAATLEAGEEEGGGGEAEEKEDGEKGRGIRERRQGGESEEDEYATLGGGREEGEEVGILASLKQQWQRNVEYAREAAEARQQAERLLKDVQAHHTTRRGQQEQPLPVREVLWKRRYQRDVQEEVLAARQEISRAVAAFQEASLAGVPERAATDRACADVAAVAALTGLSPEANPAIGSDASVGGSAGDPGGNDWVPVLGEPVYVRRFGTNMRGTVVAVGSGSGEGSAEAAAARSVTVQLGNLRLQVQRADLLPAADGSDGGGQSRTDGEAGRRGGTGGLFGSQWEQDDDSNSNTNSNNTRVSKRGGQFPSPSSSSSSPLPAVREAAVQTARNTVDVRGQSAEDALAAVDLAVQSSPPGAVLFIVHGLGTGVLRAAVLKYLSGSPLVSRHEAESRLNIGCTIVYIG
ncbi:unnamed protein product [Closterium sp. Naga37s-1]|nr:unnamed protein product [Closterium sp. Naga37s-1]